MYIYILCIYSSEADTAPLQYFPFWNPNLLQDKILYFVRQCYTVLYIHFSQGSCGQEKSRFGVEVRTNNDFDQSQENGYQS